MPRRLASGHWAGRAGGETASDGAAAPGRQWALAGLRESRSWWRPEARGNSALPLLLQLQPPRHPSSPPNPACSRPHRPRPGLAAASMHRGVVAARLTSPPGTQRIPPCRSRPCWRVPGLSAPCGPTPSSPTFSKPSHSSSASPSGENCRPAVQCHSPSPSIQGRPDRRTPHAQCDRSQSTLGRPIFAVD